MSELAGCLTAALISLPPESTLQMTIAANPTPVFAGRHSSVRLPEAMRRRIYGSPMSPAFLAALAAPTRASLSHELVASFEILRYSSAVNRFMSLLLEGDTQAFALEACKDLIAANAIDFLRSQHSVLTNVSDVRAPILALCTTV